MTFSEERRAVETALDWSETEVVWENTDLDLSGLDELIRVSLFPTRRYIRDITGGDTHGLGFVDVSIFVRRSGGTHRLLELANMVRARLENLSLGQMKTEGAVINAVDAGADWAGASVAVSYRLEGS